MAEMEYVWVNGILLLIPFLMIRFGLLSVLNPQAIQRAAYFAPVQGKERIAYYIYQISNVGIFYLLFRDGSVNTIVDITNYGCDISNLCALDYSCRGKMVY